MPSSLYLLQVSLQTSKNATISKLKVGAKRVDRKVLSVQKTIHDLSRASKDEKEMSPIAMTKLVENAEAR